MTVLVTRTPARPSRPADRTILARLLEAVGAARERARARADLRRALRADARLRRDLGLSRFDVAQLADGD